MTQQQIKIGLIGGSGLGAAMAGQTSGARHEIDTPFGRPSDAIVETAWDGVPVLFLSRHGPGHLLNPSQVNYRANLFALKALGCTHILASGAVGSLREEYKPRDLVIVDQVIDKTHRRVGTFFEAAAVHVEMAEPFCPILRQILVEAGKAPGLAIEDPGAGGAAPSVEPKPANPEPTPASPPPGTNAEPASPETRSANPALPHSVHPRGTYVCMEGPAFSTRAESLMHRLWGGDVIGMTAMPEAKLAKEAEIPYALIALVTDYDCWRPHADAHGHALDPFKLLNEIIGHLKDATDNAIRLMRATVAAIAADPSRLDACPATRALQLAIWSDKSRIDPSERQRLGPIWMKYFEQS